MWFKMKRSIASSIFISQADIGIELEGLLSNVDVKTIFQQFPIWKLGN